MTSEDVERRVGFKLTPAQRAFVEASARGERVQVLRGGRAVGWRAVQEAVVHFMREDCRM